MAYSYAPYPPVPYPGWYQTSYYYPPQPSTPFVPNLALYNSSPWTRTSPLPPVSPYLPPPASAPATVHFPSTEGGGRYNGEYIELGNVATPMRERRPSLSNNSWLQPLAETGRTRRHSFNPATTSAPVHWTSAASPFYLNPWINAESPRFDFDFDLSKTKYSPLRLYGGGQALDLPTEELIQPATYPSVYKLRITHDDLPNWPIELQWNSNYAGSLFSPGYAASAPPISLSDILIAVHQSLHVPARQPDYDGLNSREKESVGQAYRARCSAAGSYHEQEAERAKGIKRVDFLGKKKRFVGLTRLAPFHDWEHMKFHTR